MAERVNMPNLGSLRERLCAELPVNLLYEHDEDDHPAFELDIVPQLEMALTHLRRLDGKRLRANPETSYLFAVHALEVATDLESLAHRVGTPEHVATTLYYLGLIHDIGKIFLPVGIWDTSAEKPSGAFKALRRTHGALGAAYLSANPAYLEPPFIDESVLPFIKGEKPISDIAPRDLALKSPLSMDYSSLQKTILSSPFRASKSTFIPLAVTACLRHHEKTGTEGPVDQPLWLKLLALLEDLSGNMVERPHFSAAGRKTSLADALCHMHEEGENAHDLGLLRFLETVKAETLVPDLKSSNEPLTP